MRTDISCRNSKTGDNEQKRLIHGKGEMKMKKADPGGKKKVKISFEAEPGKEISVAGTFNKWQSGMTKLKRNKSGSYTVTLQLPAGRYEYKFIVDGKWCMDPQNPEAVPNDCGSMNNVLIVS